MIANPLTKSDLAAAQAGLYECSECQKLAEAIQACSLDCQEQLVRNEQLRQFFQGILTHFSPQAWNNPSG